jgi:hypothetical protein
VLTTWDLRLSNLSFCAFALTPCELGRKKIQRERKENSWNTKKRKQKKFVVLIQGHLEEQDRKLRFMKKTRTFIAEFDQQNLDMKMSLI